MKSWIFIIFLNWNECWQMKNQEMAEAGKTARLPLYETYVLALWKNKEKEIPQIAAHRWLFRHPKLTPRSSPAAQSLGSAQTFITEMTLLLPWGKLGTDGCTEQLLTPGKGWGDCGMNNSDNSHEHGKSVCDPWRQLWEGFYSLRKWKCPPQASNHWCWGFLIQSINQILKDQLPRIGFGKAVY